MITGIVTIAQNVTIILDNGKKFEHPLATTTFGFDLRKDGTAMLNENMDVQQWTVRYANGRMHFSEPVNGVSVYALNGALVAQFAGKHIDVPVSLMSGIYIVQAADKSAKLLVSNSNGSTIAQPIVIKNYSVEAFTPNLLRTGKAIKVYWNIKANNSTSVEMPDVEKFYFTADNSIILTMKNGVINEIVSYYSGDFAIEPFLPDADFCPFLTTESINEIIPAIDDFLAGMQETLNDEQQLQMLTVWLNAHSCILDATIFCNSCVLRNPEMSEILFSFIEHGIKKDLILDILMTSPLQVSNIHEHYTPMDVFMQTKNYFTIDKAFDFINSLDLEVELIQYGVYVSTMSSDKLQYILDNINSKPYTNDGNVWWTTGHLHYLTNQITIFPMLYKMKNKEYQNDWLQTMNEYKLVENFENDFSGYLFHFRVSEGTEKQWEPASIVLQAIQLPVSEGTEKQWEA